MNFLLVFLSAITVNFAAAEAKVKNLQVDEEEVGSPCLGFCTAFIVGVVIPFASSAAGAAIIGTVVGGAAVYGLTKGYEWYVKAPGYELRDYGTICPTGMLIDSFNDCQKAFANSAIQNTQSLVKSIGNSPDHTSKPKGCYVASKETWFNGQVVEVIWNKNGDPNEAAMKAINANPFCKHYDAAEELEAQVAEAKLSHVSLESQVASSAISGGQHDILNKILYMFIGASLSCVAMYFTRKEGGLLNTDYEMF